MEKQRQHRANRKTEAMIQIADDWHFANEAALAKEAAEHPEALFESLRCVIGKMLFHTGPAVDKEVVLRGYIIADYHRFSYSENTPNCLGVRRPEEFQLATTEPRNWLPFQAL
ncbi:hypothetical protein [Oligosphaera ethanolica]|uniref:Uncharacterized protein n=1 Tax=Oligosphaera ethanolica TaxID=760260 RepID=A0AAE3VCW0_9BACT|nr:hypothetical protein [Oligosphaera ethanolica]MDQ0287978.1 hypothetical protein [Oligosphaera ethanolica]